MDPITNLRTQRTLTRRLLADAERAPDDARWVPDPSEVHSLCELVQALDGWMSGGGFSPWNPPGSTTASPENAASGDSRVWHQELA